MKDFTQPEAMNEELRSHLKPATPQFPFTLVHHPLVVELILDTNHCAHLNAHFEHQRQRLAKARREKDWHSYVWIHARPYRLDAFAQICEWLEDRLYWSTLGEIWVDTEGAHVNLDLWRLLFTINRPQREFLMTVEDYQAFHQLPDPAQVYRGFNGSDYEQGLSWTTDYQMAIWYAKRFATKTNGKPCVATGTVAKVHVLAHFGFRGEGEVVVFPENVKHVRKDFL